MAVLQKQETEIPLNGGMDVKQGAELQAANTLRLVEDLRWNAAGELEKRPATASDAPLVASLVSAYTSTVLTGVYARGDEVFSLTEDHGLVSVTPDGQTLNYAHAPLDEAATSGRSILKYAPQCANVSRRFVARANGQDELVVDAAATAIYNGSQMIAWTTRDGSLNTTLHVKIVDLATGTVTMAEQTAVLGANTFVSMSAAPHSEVGYEGILITVSTSAPAPFSIVLYRWDAASNDLGIVGTLTANAKVTKHAIASNGATYYFAYTDDTTGFLTAYSGCTVAGGLGTVHTATHGAYGGVAFVVGGTRTLIASIDRSSIIVSPNRLYAEVFGSPGSAVLLESVSGAAGSDAFGAIHAARETRTGVTNAAAIFVTGTKQGLGPPAARFVHVDLVDFTTTTPASIQSDYFPHIACIGAGTMGGRAYGVFALNPGTLYPDQSPTSLVVARLQHDEAGSVSFRLNPVARCCHDRFAVPDYNLTDNDAVSVDGASLYFATQADPLNGYPQTLFLSHVDLDTTPMSRADMSDGTAIFGHGLLHSYDGETPSEAQPLIRPVVALVGAAGVNIYTGTVSAIAVITWVDAAGVFHRSEPSAPSTLTMAAQSMSAYVSINPFTAYDGVTAREVNVELYLTALNGSIYYRASGGLSPRTYDAITTLGVWYQFIDLVEGSASVTGGYTAAFSQVYTTQAGGEEWASKSPAPFRSWAPIGDRLWAVDSEDPTRIWFTKPLVAGYAPEWNILGTLFIGDAGVGISDVNGVPTVFAERGIWQIYGEGPNKNGVGSFMPARRLPHEVECLDGLSVCKTSAGVFFRGRRGVYLLDMGLALQPVGLSVDPSLTVSGVPSGFCRVVYDELSNEVHVLDFDNSHYVFNMLEGKWCTWTQTKPFQQWMDAVTVRGRVHFVHTGSLYDSIRRLRALDETDHNTHTLGWTIETPWYRFDGATGEMRIWEVIQQMRATGVSNGIERGGGIDILYETRDAEDGHHTWSGGQVHTLTEGAGNAPTLNLRCRITNQRARQFRLTISEQSAGYAYAGYVPIALRIKYGITPNGGRQRNTAQNKSVTAES